MKTYCRVLCQWGKEAGYCKRESIGLVAIALMAELISDDDTALLKLVRLVKYEGFYAVICGVVGSMSPCRRSSL